MNAAKLERVALGAIVIGLVALAAADFHSKIATQSRSFRPWLAGLSIERSSADPSGPANRFVLAYFWDRRTLRIAAMPKRMDITEPFRAAGGRLMIRIPAPASVTTGQDLKAWLLSAPKGIRFWLALPRMIRLVRRDASSELGVYDAFVLARELYRLEPYRIRSQELVSNGDVRTFFSRLESGSYDTAPPGPLAVAVLNASNEPGVALQATKVLRWRGLDVVDFGNAAAPSPSTRLIDHGATDPEIETLMRKLGCGDLDVAEAFDSGRRERVTIVLGRDYARCSLFGGVMKGT